MILDVPYDWKQFSLDGSILELTTLEGWAL